MSGSRARDIEIFVEQLSECLNSQEKESVLRALKYLCGYYSRGVNLRNISKTDFLPMIVRHVVSDSPSVEILAQMFTVLYSSDDPVSLSAINSLHAALDSSKETRRIRAMKTLPCLEHPELLRIIREDLRKALRDDSPFVKKAALLGAAKVAFTSHDMKMTVRQMIEDQFENSDPQVIAGCISACELIGETKLIIDNKEHLWQLMTTLDGWTQARALHYLRTAERGRTHESVLHTLLRSNYPAVLFETVQFFEDDPDLAIPPLIKHIYSPPVIAIHAFVLLLEIARKHPEHMAPFANHFLPPQTNEHASHFSVEILSALGDKCPPNALLRWALTEGNMHAVSALGKIGDKECLRVLLECGNDEVAEVAAFYASKVFDQSALASLIEIEGPRSAVVAVFSDACRENQELSETMLKVCIDKFKGLSRETRNEAALLAARLVECGNCQIGNEYLKMCVACEMPDVSKRAQILTTMLASEKLRKTVWETREPPEPSSPVIFVPKVK